MVSTADNKHQMSAGEESKENFKNQTLMLVWKKNLVSISLTDPVSPNVVFLDNTETVVEQKDLRNSKYKIRYCRELNNKSYDYRLSGER